MVNLYFHFPNIKFVNCVQFVDNICFHSLGEKQRVNIQLNLLFCGWESNVDQSRTFTENLLFKGAAKRHTNTRTKRYPEVNMKLNFWNNNPNRLILFLWYFTNYTSFIEKFTTFVRTHQTFCSWIGLTFCIYNQSNSCANKIIIMGKKKKKKILFGHYHWMFQPKTMIVSWILNPASIDL